MATTFDANYLKSYTNDTWTALVTSLAGTSMVVRHYMMCNTGESATEVSMRIVDNGATELAILVNAYSLETGKPLNCTDAFILLKDGDVLQVKAAAAGVHFSAWGGYE